MIPTGVELWQQAASFAARAHLGMRRKDGATPYFAHPARVAMTVRDVFGCDDAVVIAAAYLHDTIEDTTTDYDDLAEAFGDDVARCVVAVTKNMMLPEAEREHEYDARLARADWRARLVKLGDVYDNFSDMTQTAEIKRERMLSKCRRAFVLASVDRSEHACVDRAMSALEALVTRHEMRLVD